MITERNIGILKPLKNSLVLLIFLCCSVNTFSQITSPIADYTQPTQYTNGMANDEIFVFCSPDVNGNAVTGSLSATPTIAGPGYTFDWGLYDSNTYTYTSFLTENGQTSTIANLASGGYNVTITNDAGETETFITWVYVSIVDVSISLTLDPVNPGCEPFEVNGTINASGFTYWDPVDPGAAPFIIDANTTIEICFNANHTYVSDLGFVLVGPPGCGSPGVTLSPNPQVINNANGCCCNSGNNINNLCFNSNSVNQLNMCGSGTPLGGTYGFYNGNFPGMGGANYPQGGISALYGCNAAEGGWAIQIYDCIGADVGALTGVTITFTNGPSQIVYSSGAINSTINDNSCTPGTASIYVVPMTTVINPDPQQVPNSGTLTYQLGLNGNPVSLAQGTNSFTQTVDPIPTYDEWYYLFIQDQLGCSAIDSVMFELTGYADATINDINPTNQLCTEAAPVQLTSVTSGGTWSGNGVNATGIFSAATAGVGLHTITHTIDDPCGDVQTMDISVSDLVVTISSSTDALCNASCDGDATVVDQNGTAPFQFLWDDMAAQSTATATNLCAGIYNVAVLDANGCAATAQAVISEPTAIVGNAVMDIQSNCNLPDGQASVTANGGTVANDYSYAWNTVPVQNTAVATGLVPAIYTVSITDDNGCVVTADAVITSTPGFTIDIPTFTGATCRQGCDGSADLTVSNGAVLPTTYLWSNGQTTTTASLLCAGDYTVTVTDDVGCEATASVTISEPTLVTTQPTVSTSPICIGEGSDLTSGVSGGTTPYATYLWTAVPADGSLTNIENPTVSPIVSTVYSVIATDANGCVSVV
ncbi:MAG: hypothetical protein JKX84_02525, partial [Flavobacteriales bacterium]|nr:hypothetical protein [Flavobacteriales bacterium]